jgi:hypothetical protein
MLLLHSGCAQHLFPNVRPFEVPLATLSLIWFFRHLCSTTGPLWSRPICRAAPAWWVICLLVAANFFQDPPLPWVHFFGCWRHPTTRCRSPYRSFSALTVFIAAFSLRTSSCTATDSVSTEVGSLHPDRPPSLLGRLLSLFARHSHYSQLSIIRANGGDGSHG